MITEGPEDDRMVSATGVLSTLETIVDMVEDNSKIMFHVEEEVRKVIRTVLDAELIGMFGTNILFHQKFIRIFVDSYFFKNYNCHILTFFRLL